MNGYPRFGWVDIVRFQHIEATFTFEGIDYTSTFTVLGATNAVTQIQEETGVQIHGIIGIQFLISNKWIIDFNKNRFIRHFE